MLLPWCLEESWWVQPIKHSPWAFACVALVQDCNVLQVRICNALQEGRGQLSVVGDDAQSIYRRVPPAAWFSSQGPPPPTPTTYTAKTRIMYDVSHVLVQIMCPSVSALTCCPRSTMASWHYTMSHFTLALPFSPRSRASPQVPWGHHHRVQGLHQHVHR